MMMWHVNPHYITLGPHNNDMSLPKTTKKYFTKYIQIN
jgi:hypothetical protein